MYAELSAFTMVTYFLILLSSYHHIVMSYANLILLIFLIKTKYKSIMSQLFLKISKETHDSQKVRHTINSLVYCKQYICIPAVVLCQCSVGTQKGSFVCCLSRKILLRIKSTLCKALCKLRLHCQHTGTRNYK